jgi:hypothetical protein
MSTQPTSDNTLVSTTNDKKINQAKHIYAIARQFTDATGVLEDLCSAVCDRNYSRAKLLQDVAFVKKFVIPLSRKIQSVPSPPQLGFCPQFLE